ncbi:type IV toxin-antitoxin system AbiEi family antitoxin domain-containing protein [Acidithiobacillus sulfuriphilus]|uniref:type IV toxin-antitoxin system AbiEi family antitoxin domain-containing protein n=1 Tax=Acidithiobacillus sulfuriphilus TaxID=1867749 RepID=UPI003F61E3E7
MEKLTGIGKLDRERLASILRGTKGTVSVAEAAGILGAARTDAAKMLSRWHKKGWLSRVRRGLYVPVPLEASAADVPLEDPWQIAASLFDPCYIGGWSAAEYWDLTEQIFRTTVVMTQRTPRDRNPVIKGAAFLVCSVNEKKMFGLKTIWRGQVKVSVSDPTRTILDMLAEPRLGGGIRSVNDMLLNYLRSEAKNLDLLIGYADQLGNGAVFKRLGFLLERHAPNEQGAIEQCGQRLTKGNARIDPKQPAERLVSRWRLWVPESWLKGAA